jgi:hypothetical protein
MIMNIKKKFNTKTVRKKTPISEALLDRDKYEEMFCKGTFWYFWTMDKLREILGENKRKELTFDREEEILELREQQRVLEKKLVHLNSRIECRKMMTDALQTGKKLKRDKETKRRMEVGSIKKEYAKERSQYVKIFAEFRRVSKQLEKLELDKLANLQCMIPVRYMEKSGIDMEEDSKIGELMEIMMNRWKDVGGSGLKYVNKDKCLEVILNTTFLALNDKFVYQDDVPKGNQRIQLIRDLKENVWLWYKWRKKLLKNSEMWERCCKFEKSMERAGIKGRSITGEFEVNMFEKEVWSFYDVEKWIQEEKGKKRFMFEGEENLEVEDFINQLRARKGRLKDKKRKGRKKKTPDKVSQDEVRSKGRNKKPSDKLKGMIDALYGITVMGKQSGVEVNKSKELNLSSGNLEVLIKMKSILKMMIAVLWNAEIKRSSKSFRFVWRNIVWNEVTRIFEETRLSIEEMFVRLERILAKCKLRWSIPASDGGIAVESASQESGSSQFDPSFI